MQAATDIDPQKLEYWIKTRRDIHAHPELRYEEERTAAIVKARLEELGYEVESGFGKTGVIGLLKGKSCPSNPKRVGLRADMDALPILELNKFDHASKNAGKMHACGHDGHTAMLLGAAQELAESRDFEGEVLLIFQPAEEGGAGARRMIEDGLFDKYPVDAVYAMHNWPGLSEGEFAAHVGPVMASSNEFHITVTGKGCHAAMPNLGIDPIVIGAQVVQALQTIVSRSIRPVDAAVISVTQFHAGNTINVIPENAEIKGTVRTFSLEVLDLIEERLIKTTQTLCEAMGASAQVEFKRAYPPTINDQKFSDIAARGLQQLTNVTKVHRDLDPTMGSEDFAYMLQHAPGAYLWIGNGDGGHREAGHGLGPCMLHNPSYDFNDGILGLGVQAWLAIVNQFFTEEVNQ